MLFTYSVLKKSPGFVILSTISFKHFQISSSTSDSFSFSLERFNLSSIHLLTTLALVLFLTNGPGYVMRSESFLITFLISTILIFAITLLYESYVGIKEATLFSAEKLNNGHCLLTKFSGLITTGAGVKVLTGIGCLPDIGGAAEAFRVFIEVALLVTMLEPYKSFKDEIDCLFLAALLLFKLA